MQVRIDERLVQRRLNENEGQYLEFKSAYNRSGGRVRRRQARTVAYDVAEALCAFANADGGTLIIGVEDDKTVTGVPYPPDRLQVLIRAPETHCRPPVAAQWALVSYAGVEVLAFVTDSSVEAHSLTDGRTPLRVGDATISLPPEDVAALKRSKVKAIFERQIISGASIHDLDLDLVQEYATRTGEADSVAALESLDLILHFDGQVRVTLAALLLFGRKPMIRWHSRAGVEFLRFRGTERLSGRDYNLIMRRSFNEPLPRLIQQVWEFVDTQVKRETKLHDLFFWERAEYPPFAWQEAIVNAIAHRDYSITGMPVEVLMFDDRIEVKSPGLLPEPLTLEDIRARKNVHLSRNPRIVQVLKTFGVMQEAGEGIPRMYREMELSGLHPPEFDQDRLHFYVTLRNAPIYDEATMRFLDTFRSHDLNDRQVRALAYASRYGSFNRSKYRGINDVDSDTAQKEIAAMEKLGIVQRRGRKRGSHYVVIAPEPVPEKMLRQFFRDHDSISNREYRELRNVSRSMAWKELSQLVEEGKLERVGTGRWTHYLPTAGLWGEH